MEGKAPLTNRLRAAGQWDEASGFKDQIVAQLRKEGMSKVEASEKGWEALREKYPQPTAGPGTTGNAEVSNLGDDVLDSLPDSSASDFLSDATWTYNNLGRAHIQFESAPTSGAASLLRWARKSEDDFFKQVWPKALALAEKKPPADEIEKASLDQVASLEEMLYGKDWDPSKEKRLAF